eukprot:CAMPEP_0167832576 /NCGR_PEP_ID=MMETSP0112_2-20121227/14451_1 /TAXON_ID=91324 /ORGANISM="Lotharella globosa, Strain CCCM811" /LENGTH=56 /DNA_ID=CAMNT_0007737715 /DNA_START=22 /DNA_END=188 /DNA_ORIENTATION=-
MIKDAIKGILENEKKEKYAWDLQGLKEAFPHAADSADGILSKHGGDAVAASSELLL